MEEYAGILGIQIKNQVPFLATKEEPDVGEISRALYLSQEVIRGGLKEKGNLPGFHLSLLEAKAKEYAALGNWRAVCALIAVSVYGIILFPNQKNFVDINAIRLFVQRNPIPTLIGDVYYSVHNRNEKRRGGLIRCCAQLLYKWFMGYLPTKGAFVLLDHTVSWATKLMGLRAKDITWTHIDEAGRDFICSCGSFPNVPLIGVQGCISYNPTLLKRQRGFAMEAPPLEYEIQDSCYFPVESNRSALEKVSEAWRNIQRKGKIPFGRANSRSFPLFDEWLRRRVEFTRLPFPVGDLWYPVIEKSRSSISIEEFLEMKRERDQLQVEKTELEMRVARIQMTNQEIKGKMEDQDKRHALVVERFEIDTAYYGKVSQALESSIKEHDLTKEKLARALRVIEEEKRRQILVRDQRDAGAKVLATKWEAEKAKIIAERDHYLAERDHYFRQMKMHQKEIGRLQQENTKLRFAVKFTQMVDDAEPSAGPPSV
jgi:hypothetical protein